MKVLVSGADGFIGRNLSVALRERPGYEVVPITKKDGRAELRYALERVDAVVHLAGINRPEDPAEFSVGNVGLTNTLCELLDEIGRTVPIAFSSSIQAELDNHYGHSKRSAEERLILFGEASGSPVSIYRLPNVFGKWSRPHYNSAVATFCHCIAREQPIRIDDPSAVVRLLYIDDLVSEFLDFLNDPGVGVQFPKVGPVYDIRVGELADQIKRFKNVRDSLVTEPVGLGLVRALYATYLSFLPTEMFSYSVPRHSDDRGVFVEMLKTRDSGQFSFFTAHPGVTRGGHYHHTKSEKFLVLKGRARYRFRNLATEETVCFETDSQESLVVETIPGWAHDITNTGEDELVVMLWANEQFDRDKPDSVSASMELEVANE